MPRFEPVEHDPFALTRKPVYVLPIDHDPFRETPKKADNSDLSLVQRGFLGALDVAERAGAGGTALKLYNSKVGRGDRAPITEKDFAPGDLEMFRKLVAAEQKRSGPSGTVLPGTYDDVMMQGRNPDYNMIGGFQYETAPDGSAVIRDTYDFNMDRAGGPGIESEGGMFQAIQSPFGFAASIGRKRVPDTSGGVPIEIRLEPVDHDPFAQ
jgi:hypothetical protein